MGRVVLKTGKAVDIVYGYPHIFPLLSCMKYFLNPHLESVTRFKARNKRIYPTTLEGKND